MTSIANKQPTTRLATAVCRISFSNPIAATSLSNPNPGSVGPTSKGDVLAVARVAGIMTAKKTPDIIPLAHPGLGIAGIEVDLDVHPPRPGGEGAGQVDGNEQLDQYPNGSVLVTSTVSCYSRTGVEMEALTAVLGAALTVYDMCKAADKGMVIGEARVVRKTGGKSGDWSRA